MSNLGAEDDNFMPLGYEDPERAQNTDNLSERELTILGTSYDERIVAIAARQRTPSYQTTLEDEQTIRQIGQREAIGIAGVNQAIDTARFRMEFSEGGPSVKN